MRIPRTRLAKALPYALVLAAGAYLYYAAANIQYSARAGTLGPDFWPKLILILLIAICAFEVIRILFARADAQVAGVLEELVDASGRAHADAPAPAPTRPRPWMLLAGIALTGVYVAVIQKLGFFSATVFYLAAFIALGGYRRWGVIATASALGTLLMFFFFVKVVYISLPVGEPPFREVTLYLMQLLGIR